MGKSHGCLLCVKSCWTSLFVSAGSILPSKTWWPSESERWTAALLSYFSCAISVMLPQLHWITEFFCPPFLHTNLSLMFLLAVCVLCCSSPSLSNSIDRARAEFARLKHLLLSAYSPKDCPTALKNSPGQRMSSCLSQAALNMLSMFTKRQW